MLLAIVVVIKFVLSWYGDVKVACGANGGGRCIDEQGVAAGGGAEV